MIRIAPGTGRRSTTDGKRNGAAMGTEQYPAAVQGYEAMRREDWAAGGALLAQAAAECEYEHALELWFNAALAYKFLRDWARAFELGRKAAACAEPGTQSPAFWNLGIAATAQREWDVARSAWADYGVRLPPGEGEIRQSFGLTPIRLRPAGGEAAQVVLTERICPTRAVVREIPRHSGRRFGDVLLHDGAPVGNVVVDDESLMVFDEIEVWRESQIPAWSARAAMDSAGHGRLLRLFGGDQDVEDRETSCRTAAACTCCGAGEGDGEGLAAAEAQALAQEVLFAAPEEKLRELLDEWVNEEPGQRSYRDLTLLVRAESSGV